ncbi:MAG TPA: hypothetical protein DHM90_12710 [Clostridiaceae bacterium]|nr:hypothetical protein [Clostridiaceae bacterium]
MNRSKFSVLIIFLVVVLVSAGGGFFAGRNMGVKNVNISVAGNSDIVSIRMTDQQSMPSGTGYTVILRNMSDYIIRQKAVYISYPIRTGNNLSMNKWKVEMTGNKLDLKPGEEITLNAFIPLEITEDSSSLDIDQPQYEISGYLGEVTATTHFTQSGELAE